MSVLVPRDECWSVNRVLINEVNEILKYQCNINGFAFIFQDCGWTLANASITLSSIKICYTSSNKAMLKVNNINNNSTIQSY